MDCRGNNNDDNNNNNNNSSMNVNDQPPQCANGCGFYGKPATQNLCSVCYRDFLKKAALQQSPTTESHMKSVSNDNSGLKNESIALLDGHNNDDITGFTSNYTSRLKMIKTKCTINRCDVCKKRVGLTGFECRCGGLYCMSHRYPEEHCCDFDHKKLKLKALSEELFSAASDLKAAKLQHRA